MAAFINTFNALNDDAQDYNPAIIRDYDINTVSNTLRPNNDLDPDPIHAQLHNNNYNNNMADINTNAMAGDIANDFASIEQSILDLMANEMGEEGDFAPYENYDAQAFNANASTAAGRIFHAYLDQTNNSATTAGLEKGQRYNNDDRIQKEIMVLQAIQDAAQRAAELDAKIKALDVDITNIENEIANIDKILADIAQRRSEYEARLEDAQKEYDETEITIAQLEDERGSAQTILEDSEIRLEEATKELTSALLSGNTTEIQAAQEEHEEARVEQERAAERVAQIEAFLDEGSERLRNLRIEINDLETKITELDKEAEDYLEQRTKLGEQLEEKLQERADYISQRDQFNVQVRAPMESDPATYNSFVMQEVREWEAALIQRLDDGDPRAESRLEKLYERFGENLSNANVDTYLASITSFADRIYDRTQDRIRELREELDTLRAEHDQAIADERMQMTGAAGLIHGDVSEINQNALTAYDENGSPIFKIMASYDEDGNMTGIMASDSRLMREERATQEAQPLESFNDIDQVLILTALEDAKADAPDGIVTLPDGNEFNSALARSREASEAAARNEQFDATYGVMSGGMSRAELTAQAIGALETQLSDSETQAQQDMQNTGDAPTDSSLSASFAHADQFRTEPLDNPTITTQPPAFTPDAHSIHDNTGTSPTMPDRQHLAM